MWSTSSAHPSPASSRYQSSAFSHSARASSAVACVSHDSPSKDQKRSPLTVAAGVVGAVCSVGSLIVNLSPV